MTWRSYCLEIRDDYGVADTVPEKLRPAALAGHALSHRMLRIFEAARAEAGEEAVDALYREWGRRFFASQPLHGDALLSECVAACGLAPGLVAAAEDGKWDGPIGEAMEVAYAFGGPKTQTPTIVVRADPPYGFKGPVMAPGADRRRRPGPVGRHRGHRPGARVLRDHAAARQPPGGTRAASEGGPVPCGAVGSPAHDPARVHAGSEAPSTRALTATVAAMTRAMASA